MRAVALLAGGLMVATTAHAASSDSTWWMAPQVGDRVRLTTSARHSDEVIGRVVRTDDSLITLVTRESNGDRPATVTTAERCSLTRIEWHDGYDSRDALGMTLGFVAGAVVGGVIGARSDQGSNEYPIGFVYGGVGAMLGLVAGWMIGAANPHERWSSNPSDGIGLRIRADGPVQIAIRASF